MSDNGIVVVAERGTVDTGFMGPERLLVLALKKRLCWI